MDTGFWNGRRVLLTGHTGFKGGWLALWLKMAGARVFGLSLAPDTTPSLFESAGLADACEASTIGDIRDAATVERAMAKARPELVLHLAAQPLVRRAYAEPLATLATNVMGTAHVLEAACHRDEVRAVIIVTTDKCYENREWFWGYREIDRLGGRDPYAASKACAELVTHAWRESYCADGRPLVASVRAGNVIGGGDWAADRLVPDLVRALAAGAPATLRQPRAVRPWQHVLEPLAGYLLLAERLLAGDGACARAWNFGPAEADAIPVGALAAELARRWGVAGEPWQPDIGHHPHEAHFLRLDSSCALAELGWRRRLPLADALDWTVAWYAAFAADPARARALTEDQILRYQALADHG